ncbi:MAG: ATP-binding protein [Desulfobacterota bacterium]|nr:ATP-binding protein [Thermodesulfobacteriota bacterium]
MNDNLQIPDTVIAKWQDILDLIARLLKVPAALIMRLDPPDIEVLVASRSEGNPFKAGDRSRLETGLYCETVMRTNHKLLVANALKDPLWERNPDIAHGMISYLGFPLHWPGGKIFGTICVLDRKENPYTDDYVALLEQFQKVVDGDLAFHVILTEQLLEKEQALATMAKAQAEQESLFAESERSRIALLNILEDEHITQQRLRCLLEERETLLREVHHRVKNNLQIIISLLNLQARTLNNPEAQEALQTSQHRIRAIAAVHEKLYQSENIRRVDFGAYVSGLTRQLSAAYALPGTSIAIHTQLDSFLQPVDVALPLGLLVNELVTNALKHAFTGRKQGSITIILQHNAQQIRLTVHDDGAGIPEAIDEQNGGGLGMTLVRTLTRQINGTLRIERIGGTAVSVTFPSPTEATNAQA